MLSGGGFPRVSGGPTSALDRSRNILRFSLDDFNCEIARKSEVNNLLAVSCCFVKLECPNVAEA